MHISITLQHAAEVLQPRERGQTILGRRLHYHRLQPGQAAADRRQLGQAVGRVAAPLQLQARQPRQLGKLPSRDKEWRGRPACQQWAVCQAAQRTSLLASACGRRRKRQVVGRIDNTAHPARSTCLLRHLLPIIAR